MQKLFYGCLTTNPKLGNKIKANVRYRWNRHRSYIVNIVFLNCLMQK